MGAGGCPTTAGWTRSLSFIREVTDPYLNLFRRFIPPLSVGGAGLDLSPMIATFVLIIVGRLIVSAING